MKGFPIDGATGGLFNFVALQDGSSQGFWKHSAPTSLQHSLLMFHDFGLHLLLVLFQLMLYILFLYSPETANIYLIKIVGGFLKSQLQNNFFAQHIRFTFMTHTHRHG
jgi:hypothetical protein